MSENKKWCPLNKGICDINCAWYDCAVNTCAILSLANGISRLANEAIDTNVNLDLIRKVI